MLKKILNCLTLAIVFCNLSACGNKGDLYIPVSACDRGNAEQCQQREK